jgi:hypothetical protein
MKLDLEYLDLIIKEEIQNVLSEQSFVRDGDDATLDRINKQRTPVSVEPVKPPEWAETYFKSNPGLREKYTKAYSNPNFRARADAHDAKVIANNKKYALNKKKGNVTIRQPQLTSVQLMGNKVLDDWYKNTSPEDRAMKDYSGNPSARAKFYKKMEKRATGKDASLDVSKLDSDDVYSADTGTWDDPFGLSGQTQYKFQKDIVGKPGTKIDPERLKDRSKDFRGSFGSDMDPETAGTIEDIGSFILPQNVAEIPFYMVGGPAAGKATAAFTRWLGSKIGRSTVNKLTKQLVKQGVPKEYARKKAAEHVQKLAQEKAQKYAHKKARKGLSKIKKPDTGEVTKIDKFVGIRNPGSLGKRPAKFLSKPGLAAQMKSPTFKKMMDGLKNVKGFNPDKAFSGTRAMAGLPFLTKKVGYTSQLALLAYKGCGKNRDCNDAAFKVIKDIDPEFAAAVGGEGGVRKLRQDAIKNEKASRAEFEKTENAIKNSKPGDIIKNYKRMFDDVGFEEGETVDRAELKNYFSVYAKKYGRAKVGEYQQFLDYLKQKGIKVKDQTIREHIIESVMKKLGLLT